MNVAYNMDCLAAMREMPDNAFDLAVVDPPYGCGFTEDTGGKELGVHFHGRGRSKKYQEIYSQSFNVEREREREQNRSITALEIQAHDLKSTNVKRTGGAWAAKYGKKLSRGTQPQKGNILNNSFVSHAIKSFGAGTTLNCRRRGASLCGKS